MKYNKIGQLSIDINLENLFNLESKMASTISSQPLKVKEKTVLIKSYQVNETTYKADQWSFVTDPTTRSKIAFCIANNLPIYLIAQCQSGKTFYKFYFAEDCINQQLCNSLAILPTGLKSACNQMFERADVTLKQFTINSTELTQRQLKPGYAVVAMTHESWLPPLIDGLNKANQHNPNYIKMALFIDESHEREPAQGDYNQSYYTGSTVSGNKTRDRLLFDLTSHPAIGPVFSVSATLFGQLMASASFANTKNYIHTEQLIELPLSKNYHGLTSQHFEFSTIFVDDVKYIPNAGALKPYPKKSGYQTFTGDSYTDQATLQNTKNPKNLVDNLMVELALRPFNDIPNICVVAMSKTTNGHMNLMKMLERRFVHHNEVIETWTTALNSINDLDNNATVVLIEHNGDKDPMEIGHKLWLLAHRYPRGQIKQVCVVAKEKLKLSNTVEPVNPKDSKDRTWMNDCNHIAFGWYANQPAYYGTENGQLEAVIQLLGRGCGNRIIGLKRHVAFTTPEEAELVKAYYEECLPDFINEVALNKKLDKPTLVTYYNSASKRGYKRLSRNPTQSHIPKPSNSNSSRRTGQTISSSITSLPMITWQEKISKADFDYIKKATEKDAFTRCVNLGWNPTKTTITHTIRKSISSAWTSLNSARPGFEIANFGNGCSITLSKLNGDYYVICVDLEQKKDPHQNYKDIIPADKSTKGSNYWIYDTTSFSVVTQSKTGNNQLTPTAVYNPA